VLTYSPARGAENELTVTVAPMLQIMQAFASYVDLPEAHLKAHIAPPAATSAATENRQLPVRIHSGKDNPANALCRRALSPALVLD